MANTLRDYEREFWHRADLDFKLHEGQVLIERAFHATKGKLFVVDCSRQIGKSTWAAKKSVEVALQKPNAKIRVGTAFLTDLEQFILPAFELILQDCPEELRPQFNVQKLEYRFKNGSKIRLVGLDRKPNGLRGNRLDLVILDEAGYISRLGYLYKFVLIPSTTHVPDAKIVMTSTQPESPDHEFIQFCDRAEIDGGYIKLTVDENPLLTPEQVDDIAIEYAPMGINLSRDEKILLGKASTAYRREYLCERVVEEGRAIIPEYNDVLHVAVTPPGRYHRFWHRLEALDSGVRDQTACLFSHYDFERAKLVIENEFAISGHEVTTRRINELVREKESELEHFEKVYRRTADNDNLILIQDLGTEFKLYFNPTSKDDLAAMVNKVRLWFGQNRIEIHPRCVRLRAALKSGIWNLQRSEFARSPIHGHFDLISALVYLVRNCPDSENPIPAGWGIDSSNTLFVNRKAPLSESAKTLQKAFGLK